MCVSRSVDCSSYSFLPSHCVWFEEVGKLSVYKQMICPGSMAITGPQWSREALCVDLSLPRQACVGSHHALLKMHSQQLAGIVKSVRLTCQVQLPLPVPQHLSCWDLRRGGLHMDRPRVCFTCLMHTLSTSAASARFDPCQSGHMWFECRSVMAAWPEGLERQQRSSPSLRKLMLARLRS